MDHIESSSPSDVKDLSVDSKQDVTDSGANNIELVVTENTTSKSGENAALVSMSVGCDDEYTGLEDVKVCDTCGDAGREDLLATCNRCSDGAEHTYCMRVRLEKVPEADWVCEDCLLSEEKEKRQQTKSSDLVASPKYNRNESDQEVETSGTSNLKVNRVSGSKGLDADKNRRDKSSSLPSPKKPLSNVHSALLMRRRALGLNVLTSRKNGKAPRARDSEVNSNHELSSSKDLSGRRMRENTASLTLSGQSFPKSRELPTSSGLFTKSKSFGGSDRRAKVQFLDKNPEKMLGAKRNASDVRSLKKSLSFGDATAGRSKALDVETRTSAPTFSGVSNLKRLRHVKDCSSAEMEVKPALKKPRILSPDGSCPSASSDEVKKLSAKSNPSRELKHKGEVTSSSKSTSSRHLSVSNATEQTKLPALDKPSHQNLKARLSLDSGLNDGLAYDGTESAQGRKCETADHATNFKSEDSRRSVSAINMEREKDQNRSCGTDLASPLSYHLNVNGSSIVPMFDDIWKGEFAIQSNRRLPGVLCRIQAHLSTQSSPKIPEVVKNFSNKILAEEVSRLSIWPAQFLKCRPQDNNIGLYFFAQDVESYSKYKSFLQCMIDYDLALKGNFNGIELLIFSSNLLPEKSRRWNKLLYLWGIFRHRKFIAG